MSFLSIPFAFPLGGGSFTSDLVAKVVPEDQEAVVGSIVKVDGRGSTSSGTAGPITTWYWGFSQIPIGSQVASTGFTNIEEDGSVIGFAPDITGVYKIVLFVSDGTNFSDPVEAVVEVRVIIVPHHQGIVPDASFIWNYLSDFWTQVADRDRIETLWSAAIQVTASEMLKLFQYQYNKSIRDIQELIQKRWLSFTPALSIEPGTTTFILADDAAGTHASTYVIDPQTSLPIPEQPNYSNIITVPQTDGDFKTTSYGQPIATGRLIKVATRSYTLARAVDAAGLSSFFADRNQVPTGMSGRAWRLSSTLVSDTVDFEAQGVSPGDIMQVEITRLDQILLSNIYVQVVSVDRNRLGFVLNLKDLVDGVAGGGFTDDIITTLATDLIVAGLYVNFDGSLSYGLDAALIKSTIASTSFKRTYFETGLTQDDAINVGPFSIKARPVKIIRNKKIAIASDFVSIPILQEYIKQPNILEDDSGLYIVVDGVRRSIPRRPYLLSENLDYIVDDEASINGVCQITAGDDIIVIPNGDLLDRSVQTGDTIKISIGVTSEVFDIREVLTAGSVRVFPEPSLSSNSALFTITRRLEGKYIRFIDGIFSKTRPAPTRLWSEVSYLDNGEAIEGNFGILVGIRRDDLARVGSGVPYKSAVAGLMYALSTGPTISNLTLSAQILLGLPFAQNAGVIREINKGFRVRDDGSPLFGRILIDGIDNQGVKTGVTNIYFYPEGSQVFDIATSTWQPALPDRSGIAINPDTGVEYIVGDVVSQFAPLSKGVSIQEYISTPDAFSQIFSQGDVGALLQKYHAFEVSINSDLVSTADVDLVAGFMNRVKAHYVRLVSGLFKALADTVDVEDHLSFSRFLAAYDSSDLGTPTAFMDDQLDMNESYLSLDGLFYSRYLVGEDLVTTKNSVTVSSATGGFKNAGTGQAWDAPLTHPKDLLEIVGGSNAGKYPISAVNSDTALDLDLTTVPTNFETASGQRFILYRPIRNPIWIGKAGVTNGSSTVTVTELDTTKGGIGSSGVSEGDFLVFADLSVINGTVSKKYKVLGVVLDPTTPYVVVDANVAETTGSYSAWFVREGLIPRGTISPYKPFNGNSLGFYGNCAAAGDYFDFVDVISSQYNDWLNLACIRPGDVLVVDSIPYMILRFEPSQRRALVTPPFLSTLTGTTATLVLRPDRSTTVVSVDFLDRLPGDFLELDVVASLATGDHANTTATSKDVTLSVETPSDYARPGDYLVLFAGADSSRDIGYGAGVFPIHKLTSGGSTIHLMDALTATGTFRYGILRRLPNEG